MIIVGNNGPRDVVGVRGSQALQAFEFQFNELAADLDLRSAPGRENQVADVGL